MQIAMPLPEAADISYPYADAQAVRPISLTIRRGEIVARRGASGAGKTTSVNLQCSEIVTAARKRRVVACLKRLMDIRAKRCHLPHLRSGHAWTVHDARARHQRVAVAPASGSFARGKFAVKSNPAPQRAEGEVS